MEQGSGRFGRTQIVATIFYRSKTLKNKSSYYQSTSPQSEVDTTGAEIAPGAAPSENEQDYPTAKPTSTEPIKDDFTFDSYISDHCITTLLDVISKIEPNLDPSTAVRRRLDSPGPNGRLEHHVEEVTVEVPPSSGLRPEALAHHESISTFEHDWNVETVFQLESVYRRHKRLAVFDMDSTLIQQEVIDEIARTLGVEAEVSAITARAMNGELDFAASLRARCALLAGVSSDVWETVRPRISLTPGAYRLVRVLKRLGYTTAVLSGGFMPLVTSIAESLGLGYAFANTLALSADGKTLTGELEGEIVDGERKRELVKEIAKKEGILLEQTLVVGDGANDLPMMSVAGLGVAFNAKEKVQKAAPARLNSSSLQDLLYLLGFSLEEQDKLLFRSVESVKKGPTLS